MFVLMLTNSTLKSGGAILAGFFFGNHIPMTERCWLREIIPTGMLWTTAVRPKVLRVLFEVFVSWTEGKRTAY